MRRLKYITLSILICLVVSYLLYFIYKRGYNHHYANEIALMNERLNGNEPYDLLILGSSRTVHQVNTRIIDSIAGVNSFNAGLAGIKLMEMNTILECYLQSHRAPNLLVMDLPPGSFDSRIFPFFNQNHYYPFLDNEIVYNNLKNHRPVFLLKHLPFLQLTEINDEMRQRAVSGLMGTQYSQPEDRYKGYSPPSTDTIGLPYTKHEPGVSAPIDEEGIGYLKKTIALCKSRNIPLMLILPPAYKALELELNPDFFTTARKICEEEGVILKDYRDLPIKDDHRLFRDQTHLNRKGADIFTAFVAEDIKSCLDKQLIQNSKMTTTRRNK